MMAHEVEYCSLLGEELLEYGRMSAADEVQSQAAGRL